MWGGGLNLIRLALYDFLHASHPMWVRGLKLQVLHNVLGRNVESHPMWVRGLKPGLISKF